MSLVGLVSDETSLFGLQMATSHEVSTVHIFLVSLPVRAPVPLDWGPNLMTLFNLNYLFRDEERMQFITPRKMT